MINTNIIPFYSYELHNRPLRGTYYICKEILLCLLFGILLFFILYISNQSYVGIIIRLSTTILILILIIISGKLNNFSKLLRCCMDPIDGVNTNTDSNIWYIFVYGKYLGVFFLELNMSFSKILVYTIKSDKHYINDIFIIILPTILLTFNIFECVLFEIRIAWRYSRTLLSLSCCINIITGFILTINTFIEMYINKPIIHNNYFLFNNSYIYNISYLLWNIKFASIAQDVAMLSHIAHSHTLPILFNLIKGWDYMEYRVGTLFIHFSLGMIIAGPRNSIRTDFLWNSGFGSFYDNFQGPKFMLFISILGFISTIILNITYIYPILL